MDADILDIAVEYIANDDYNHVPEATLRERLSAIRRTRAETKLWEASDIFIAEVREALSDPDDDEYGPAQ